ncbi:hypothetical protein EDB81DRAFT_884165 [Dactylonectria macrodidyma]|uniref:Xylanolytic transcriptional activator regulatory domain-containing protein n=1 Tax=Dactylonectria macrodidyma TaxID=307937 RepID=A0A9P9ENP7_9HYPO|nr:hypothetical protein EDB81DRAFT_884165 [Dactylonectria macrodidyma]
MSSSSLSLWNEIQPDGSDQTTASGLLEATLMTDKISCQESKTDRRTRLVEAMHRAWATRWCMSDFKMSVDVFTPAEDDTLGTENSTTLRVHANLTTPMIFDHSLYRNPRFMKMCFNLYVENFWPRFPIIHLPSLAPSWENNHLLFFSMCAIGSVFAGSRDALEFGKRLRDRVGFLIMSKWKSIMSSNSSTNQMILILMQMHLDLHALLLGDSELLALSVTYLGPVVLWARRVGILPDLRRRQPSEGLHHTALRNLPESELYSRWRDWVDEEMKLRVAYTLAIIDSELGSIFSQPPLVKFRPERVRALASDALFAAQTADEWRDIAQMEASQNVDTTTWHPSTVRIGFTHTEVYRNPHMETKPPEMEKSHWLERILSITSLATEISVRRIGLVNETEVFQDQDVFLQHLVESLPPLLADKAASIEDNIFATILTNNPGSIPEENLEANILWHSTLISLLVDRDAIERYHGSEGTQTAHSTLISLPPAVVVELVLHCLVVRCLVQKLSHDQQRDFDVHKNTSETGGAPDEVSVPVPVCGSPPVRFEDWNNELNPANPFVMLIQEQSTREKLQSMLNGEDVIFSMAIALQQSSSVHGKDCSFTWCLEILANYEMGLDAIGDRAST